MTMTLYGGGNTIAQVAYVETTTKSSTAVAIPADNTTPQVTEGAEFLTVTFTPKSSSSTFYITVSASVNNANNIPISVAVFLNGGANAIGSFTAVSYGRSGGITFTMKYTNASTASTTISARYGSNTGTSYLNQTDTSTYVDGVVSSMIIYEIV